MNPENSARGCPFKPSSGIKRTLAANGSDRPRHRLTLPSKPSGTLASGGVHAKYELESSTFFPKGIVALGDYKAKLVSDQVKPTHEFNRTYELMFPDGSTRKFRVTGQAE